mmetsp:Transcript_12255/g.34820  ORF Transcript_12255/g.34820 Transcript_12255/m.34820 type:complete len:536 (-) Transcript_12255:701-2308(-)
MGRWPKATGDGARLVRSMTTPCLVHQHRLDDVRDRRHRRHRRHRVLGTDRVPILLHPPLTRPRLLISTTRVPITFFTPNSRALGAPDLDANAAAFQVELHDAAALPLGEPFPRLLQPHVPVTTRQDGLPELAQEVEPPPRLLLPEAPFLLDLLLTQRFLSPFLLDLFLAQRFLSLELLDALALGLLLLPASLEAGCLGRPGRLRRLGLQTPTLCRCRLLLQPPAPVLLGGPGGFCAAPVFLLEAPPPFGFLHLLHPFDPRPAGLLALLRHRQDQVAPSHPARLGRHRLGGVPHHRVWLFEPPLGQHDDRIPIPRVQRGKKPVRLGHRQRLFRIFKHQRPHQPRRLDGLLLGARLRHDFEAGSPHLREIHVCQARKQVRCLAHQPKEPGKIAKVVGVPELEHPPHPLVLPDVRSQRLQRRQKRLLVPLELSMLRHHGQQVVRPELGLRRTGRPALGSLLVHVVERYERLVHLLHVQVRVKTLHVRDTLVLAAQLVLAHDVEPDNLLEDADRKPVRDALDVQVLPDRPVPVPQKLVH